MQNIEKAKFPKRLHPYISVKFSSESGNLNETAKYAPKYCKSIILEDSIEKSRHIISVKRIKRTYRVGQSSTRKLKMNRWRLMMQNKFKTVLRISEESSEEKWIRMWRSFPNVQYRFLKEVSFLKGSQEENDLYNLDISKKFFRFLPGMKKLKFLSITLRRTNHIFLLKKLNSLPRILSSLQGLEIKASFLNNWQCTTFLSPLLENPNVMENVTHLSLGRMADEKSCELFKTLPKYCQKLQNLRFTVPDTYLRSYMHYPGMKSPQINAPAGYLQALESFERLERIYILVQNLWAFIDNFTAPPGLNHAILVFHGGHWDQILKELRLIEKKELSKSQPIEELFKNTHRLCRFYKSWSCLKNLKSLSLWAQNVSDLEAIIVFQFMVYLLRSLSSLETLVLNLGDANPLRTFPKGIPPKANMVEFDQIFTALKNVSSQISSINFAGPNNCLMIYRNSEEIVHFAQLNQVQIADNVSDSPSIQNILGIFKKSCQVTLKLPYVIIETNQALLDLLVTLKNLPINLRIEQIKVMIYKLDLETFDLEFGEFIEKAKRTSKVEHVSLKIQINKSFYKEYSKALAFLCDVFGGLKDFGTINIADY